MNPRVNQPADATGARTGDGVDSGTGEADRPSFTYEGVEPTVRPEANGGVGPHPEPALAAAPDPPPVPAATPAEAAETPTGTRGKKKRQRYEWVILIAISLVVALVVRAFLIQAFYIPSESMFPTLKTNDRVLVNKLAYRLGDVGRGDVIVFHAPENAGTDGVKDLIKRVVGMPGETIEGRDGIVYIDGAPLAEPYLRPDVRSTTFGPQKIPEDEYFMMGDNRQGSRDSTRFGPIEESSIVGRAFVKIWPLSDIGLL